MGRIINTVVVPSPTAAILQIFIDTCLCFFFCQRGNSLETGKARSLKGSTHDPTYLMAKIKLIAVSQSIQTSIHRHALDKH